jgi:hypothetical protein
MLVMLLLSIILATVPFAILFGSEGEWRLHKHLMHKALFGFTYPRRAHAQVHHGEFRANELYHLGERGPEVREKITMAWWNSIVIIALGGLPVYIPSYFVGVLWWPAAGWAIALTCVAVWYFNYGVYELFHYCFHHPRGYFFEKWALFRWMNGHHLLHHQDPQCNLNVVFPFADWWHGTRRPRARRPFPQPRGPSVPDVQPLAA